MQYLYHKNRCYAATSDYYRLKKHRNSQFRAYLDNQKFEDRYMNEFMKRFGPNDNIYILIGDWSEKSARRFHDCSKGIGFIKLYLRYGYKIYRVNEFKTSKMCSICQAAGCEMEKIKWVKNPRPWRRKREPEILCHGLLRCNSCGMLVGRDKNAEVNIFVAGNASVQNNVRPFYLS
jgi:hypothetical protein